MITRHAIVLVSVLIASCMIAGCGAGSGSTASHHSPAVVSSPDKTQAPPADSSPDVPASNALTCDTVVDPTGYSNGPLTANLAVAFLTDMELTDGVANLPAGAPTSADSNILDTMATNLQNYSGNQLSADAAQFSEDEQSYDPDGPVDTSYAQPLLQDIIALEKDCPKGTTLGEKWRNKAGS